VVGTVILVFVIDKLVGFRATRTVEVEGMDLGIHGEQGWMLEQVPAPSIGLPGTTGVGDSVDHHAASRETVDVH
jgi:hypothetical protein